MPELSDHHLRESMISGTPVFGIPGVVVVREDIDQHRYTRGALALRVVLEVVLPDELATATGPEVRAYAYGRYEAVIAAVEAAPGLEWDRHHPQFEIRGDAFGQRLVGEATITIEVIARRQQ